MREDGQDAVVLEYRYGSESRWIGETQSGSNEGHVHWFERSLIDIPQPEFLYVKWRNRETGKVFEDKVDLRGRLPRDLKDQTVYFMIRGAQLYVYLVSKQPRPSSMPSNGPRLYDDKIVITIYPSSTRP